MRKNITIGISALVVALFVAGCTLPSTKMAQQGSTVSQAVSDGVHRDMFKALSRENFETAKLTVLYETEKAKQGQPAEVQKAMDAVALKSIDGLKEFAKKRDFMVEWDRDHERSNSYKYVTVDAKLFSEQGVLNYIGSLFSDTSKNVLSAWDAAKAQWNVSKLDDVTKAATTTPAS